MDKTLNSPLHVKIVRFFHENQSSIDTPRGVSTWVREDRNRVRQVLEDLVSARILVAHRSSSTTGYGYTRNAKIVNKIEQFLKKRKPS